ncbi:MAG: hypothetical protein NTV58_03525 [Deltaproteobacteria bacterium]|nr:hypothetical protein [Deltaproteobacteria bacterium]
MSQVIDHFGFLPLDRILEWDTGRAIPVEDISDHIEKVSQKTNEDGYLYPPETHRYRSNKTDKNGKLLFSTEMEWKKVPKTRRPAFLHKLPVSHNIELYSTPIENDFRHGDGGFLLHFLGFLFGFRLQFKEWWHEGRIYLGGRRWVVVQPGVENLAITAAYQMWCSLPAQQRLRFTNLLYMHCRSDLYEWDWERFIINYMVFDACFKIVKELNGWKKVKHSERFDVLFHHFGIQPCKEEIIKMVDLRNGLFHETLWDGGQPCSSGIEGYRQADNLKRINERLITAIAGCDTKFIHTKWWSVGQYIM